MIKIIKNNNNNNNNNKYETRNKHKKLQHNNLNTLPKTRHYKPKLH